MRACAHAAAAIARHGLRGLSITALPADPLGRP